MMLEKLMNFELGVMEDLLLSIDSKIENLNGLISRSNDPDTDGFFDHAEYLIGAGFVVLQQGIQESLSNIKTNKSEALELGPRFPGHEPFTVIKVINACANYWKHDPEWVGKDLSDKRYRSSLDTYRLIACCANSRHLQVKDTPWIGEYLFIESYPLSNIISKVNKSGECSLRGLLPYFKEWQNSLQRE
jgi:hypothetical protein